MSSAHQLVILGLIAIVGLPCNALEETDYIRTFVRECPHGQKLSSVQSTYKWFSGNSDRKWLLECGPSPLKVVACYWKGYVNDWDANVDYNCENGMITGMEASGYGTTHGDRMFGFKCCMVEENLSNMYETKYINEFRENFKYTVKNGEYITGVFSTHSNSKEDRRWSFDIKSL